MEITAIKQQEKFKSRYSVYVDGKYSFSLGDTALLDSKLVPHQKLSPADIQRYKQLSVDGKVYANAMRYAAMRLRSEWEIQSYLQRKKASPDLSDNIIVQLAQLGFIDDKAFAQSWVENRRLLKPTSTRKLQQELKQKRLSDDIITRVLADSDEADQFALRDMIVRKRRQSRYADDMKLMQYLVRQGFGYADVKAAINAKLNDG